MTAEEVIWSNFSGRHTITEGRVHHVRSEADAMALTGSARSLGNTIRVSGAAHSHTRLVPDADVIADVSGLSGVVSTDASSQRATIWAGTPIYALGRSLHDAGLALHNQGDIDRQMLGGAAATGTHGTGVGLGSFSSCVVGARVALASGEIVDCGVESGGDPWPAVRLSLGAFGIVTQLTLDVRPAYRLREERSFHTLDEILPEIADRSAANRHFEFFWYPVQDLAVAKTIVETDDEPEYPLAAEGKRVAWNYEVLPNPRLWLHTEMEYSVPADVGPECMAAIRDLVRSDFPDMDWPLEYRTVAADDVWLSTAYERPTATISLHLPVEDDEEPMYRAAEEIFRSYDGRPHWAKVNYLDGDTLAAIHPRWADWWAVRDRVDPDGTFLNDYLRSIRP